jgi:hypothetical protein
MGNRRKEEEKMKVIKGEGMMRNRNRRSEGKKRKVERGGEG